jgi:polyhydroxybutyrate depolymerase
VADTAGFIVVYPDATGPGFNSGLHDYPGLPPLPDVNDVGFIYALIDTVDAHYDIDLSRVYCCGFSNGGIMTYRLLGEIGYRFAAVASVAGSLTDGTIVNFDDEIYPKPIIHCHGTDDDVVYYDGDIANFWSVEETIDFWRDKNRCSEKADTVSMPDLDPDDGCTVEKIIYTGRSENSCLVFYKILGGDHSWPGHTGNMDIHASCEIWNFFEGYELAVSGEDSPGSTPNHIHLSQISPNPFRSTTAIAFDLPQLGDVRISVSDISGRLVMSDALGIMDEGSHRYLFNGSDLPSGTYFLHLDAEPHSAVRPMVLVK